MTEIKQEDINRMTASFFRQAGLLMVLDLEHRQFKGMPSRSNIKNLLNKAYTNYDSTLSQLVAISSRDVQERIRQHRKENEDKVQAIANIIEKLFMLDTETVNELEDQFEELIKIVY